MIESLTPNVSVCEIIPSRRKGLTDEYLERDIWDVKLGVTHHIDAFMAGFHLIKVIDNVVTFFGHKTIEIVHEDNEGLVAFIVMHTLQALPHFVGSSALADMN